MSAKALSPGNHYLPSKSAWERYQNQGGQAEYRARGVQSQHDQVAELVGIPGYGWRVVDLIPCVPALPTVAIMPDVAVNIPPAAKISYPVCSIEVSIHSLTASVRDGDLYIEFEEGDDEDCAGEECEACDGDGCKVEGKAVSATDLLDHLLEDYSHSAESFAELHEISESEVDDLYRDLLCLVKQIKVK